jgi:branched-chain amino acid transport system substrate-binding protein
MKKIAKRALCLTAGALLVATALAGCAGKSSASEDTIKIGLLQPVTGGLAGGAAIEIEGIKLANAETPTVLGKKVELVTADNKSDKTEAANAASRLIFNDKVVAIIGSYASSPSIGAGDTIKKGETPAIGVSCTNPLVTKGNDWYFRVCFIDPYQGKVMANYAFNKMGAKTAAVTREVGSDYSVGLAQFFTDEFTRLGGKIVATADYQTGDQDFSAQITNVAKAKPDIIFTPGNFTECAMFIKQARKLGVTAPFLGGDTYETPEFLTVGGTEVNGAIFSTFFDAAAPLTSKTKPFIDKYRAANGGKDPAAVTVLAYDAYNVLLDAITRAGSTDRAKIRQALLETKDFEGVAGFVNFDENRDAKKPAVIKKVVDGKFTYVDSISAE